MFDKIQSYKFDFQKKQLGTFDYRKLMHDADVKIEQNASELIRHYEQCVQAIGDHNIGISDEKDRYVEIIKTLRRDLSRYGSEEYVADVLVQHFFGIKKSIHKAALWDAYGHVLYHNLLQNQAGTQKMCSRCGARFTPLYPHQCLCKECAAEVQKIPVEIPDAYCVDCGRLFSPTNLRQTRCTVCQWLADNAPVLPGPDEQVMYCESCGAQFTTRRSGRGKKRKVCDRCRDATRRERQLVYVTHKRRKQSN